MHVMHLWQFRNWNTRENINRQCKILRVYYYVRKIWVTREQLAKTIFFQFTMKHNIHTNPRHFVTVYRVDSTQAHNHIFYFTVIMQLIIYMYTYIYIFAWPPTCTTRTNNYHYHDPIRNTCRVIRGTTFDRAVLVSNLKTNTTDVIDCRGLCVQSVRILMRWYVFATSCFRIAVTCCLLVPKKNIYIFMRI